MYNSLPAAMQTFSTLYIKVSTISDWTKFDIIRSNGLETYYGEAENTVIVKYMEVIFSSFNRYLQNAYAHT